MSGSASVLLWAERHQVALYLVAIAAGLVGGGALPTAHFLEGAINPAIGLLLYATFLGVPFTRLGDAFRDAKFLLTVAVLNFVIVPVVVFALSRIVVAESALLIGVLLVLLTPCVDYVIIFARLAGGADDKLIAAAPLLMLAQLVLLPLYLTFFAPPGTLQGIEIAPFVEAFVFLIVIPLLLAAITQWGSTKWRPIVMLERAAVSAMVPLMMITLFVVVASQAGLVIRNLSRLGLVIVVFIAFLVIMALIGAITSRCARLDARRGRAVTFSGATRNSLVVLPLALAMPTELALVPAVVVTQTLVELVGMVVYVRLIPRLLPATRGTWLR